MSKKMDDKEKEKEKFLKKVEKGEVFDFTQKIISELSLNEILKSEIHVQSLWQPEMI